MSTATQTQTMNHDHGSSLTAPPPPPYAEYPSADERDLEKYDESSSSDIDVAEGSSSFTSDFKPNKQLQVQSIGVEAFRRCGAKPIMVYRVGASGEVLDNQSPAFVLENLAYSRWCYTTVLKAGDNSEDLLSRTMYKYGMERQAVLELADPARGIVLAPAYEKKEHKLAEGSVEILLRSVLSRTVRFEVPGLGVFGWRYEGRKGRASWNAKNLMVCEMYPKASLAALNGDGEKKSRGIAAKLGFGGRKARKEELGSAVRIAQLVRNEQYRTPHSNRGTAGNGGRLMMNLDSVGEKSRERAVWLVISTCQIMLKLEVDRREAAMAAAIA